MFSIEINPKKVFGSYGFVGGRQLYLFPYLGLRVYIMAKFNIHKNNKGEYCWYLQSKNGNKICWSE
jgi:hypothetical protein